MKKRLLGKCNLKLQQIPVNSNMPIRIGLFKKKLTISNANEDVEWPKVSDIARRNPSGRISLKSSLAVAYKVKLTHTV